MTIFQQFLEGEKASNFVLADAIYRLCIDPTNDYYVETVVKMLLVQLEEDKIEILHKGANDEN